jgi:hypothetical protein
MTEPKMDLIEITRRLLYVSGIEIRGDIVFARRLLAEGFVRTIRMFTLETFIRLFGEGHYVIEGFDVTIRGIDPEPFYINYICFEAEFRDSQWTVLTRTDEEEIFYTESDRLVARSESITERAKGALEILSSLVGLAAHLKGLIMGSTG